MCIAVCYAFNIIRELGYSFCPMKLIDDFYKDYENQLIKEINVLYFEALYQKYAAKEINSEAVDLVMNDGKNNSRVFPLPIVSDEQLNKIIIQDYEKLAAPDLTALSEVGLCLCKMQAGLGTSVKRDDLILKYENRTKLGAKGTDLFIEYAGKMLSIAEVQLLQTEAKASKKIYKYLAFYNLVNHETVEAVQNIWNKKHPSLDKTYHEIFKSNELKEYPMVEQLLMPTVAESGELTLERMAPGGHGFLGFFELLKIFRADTVNNEILAIGNGEDLRSDPDDKLVSWMVKEKLPIMMITTTKLDKDKKGGQLALVDGDKPYVTIVEKAQAQKADQLEYFEELGLRAGDKRSLFNTNIVLINKQALKAAFDQYLNISEAEFRAIITPDLIKNTKEQDGKKFIQLEGAIGSVMLNLDKYFRQNFGKDLIGFLNLAPESREKFFLPIKTREDFEEIYGT